MIILCFAKVFASSMAVLEDFDLVVGRNLLPLSNMLIFANLSGLGAFLAMETKERAILLFEVAGKQIRDWGPFLAMKEASLCKVLCSGHSFDLLLVTRNVHKQECWEVKSQIWPSKC
jgi:hypothetical protein